MTQRLNQPVALFFAATAMITAMTWAQSCRGQGQRRQRGRPDFNMLLQRHDTNQDGKISKDEFRGPERFFRRIDTDSDGYVDKLEFSLRQARGTPSLKGVATHFDQVYARVDGNELQLDLYLPANPKEIPPLVMWIHGGGWKNGSKSGVNRAILRLTEYGFAVASIDYRLGDLKAHPNHIHDCKGALRWLKAHATDYGYDSERIAVGGGSAGGHLALLLGMSAGVDELEGEVGNLDQSTRVEAIVDLYGPSDLVELADSQSGFSRRHSYSQEILESASPLRYLTDDDPPVLILQGSDDRLVLPSQSELLHERYEKAGLDSTLRVIAGAGHGGVKFSDRERFELIREFLTQHLMK